MSDYKVKENIWYLIQSMTKPEKRYFKLYTSRHSPNTDENSSYSKLFDAILLQDKYDETALKKEFNGAIGGTKFSIAKNRLYDSITKSLDAYHANSSINAQLNRQIHIVEILYKKSLYKQSYRALQSAKRLAVKYDKHMCLLEISTWEKLLIEKENYYETEEEHLISIHEQDSNVLQKVQNYNDFWHLKSRIFHILNRKGKARNRAELQQLKTIIDDTLLASEETALYPETRYLYYHIYSAYYFGIGDYENSYKYLQKNIEYIESEAEKFAEEPNVYASVLTNIIYVGSQLKEYKEVFKYLKKLRSVPEKMKIERNEDLDIKLFSSAYSIELTLHAVMGEFEKGLKLVPVVEEGLKLYGAKVSTVRKASFYFNISITYFGNNDLASALRWNNKLLGDLDMRHSEDIHCFAQIMNLIIHFEMDNQRLIPYAMKSAERYLKSRNRVYKFETTMLKFIKKLLRLDYFEPTQAYYQALHTELQELEKDEFERTAFEYFDFAAWAKAKAENRPFVEVIKEKAKKGSSK